MFLFSGMSYRRNWIFIDGRGTNICIFPSILQELYIYIVYKVLYIYCLI